MPHVNLPHSDWSVTLYDIETMLLVYISAVGAETRRSDRRM